MTFELDTLIAIAFLAPVAFFAVLNIVMFRTRGYACAVRPVVRHEASATVPASVSREAANDDDFRKAA